ncbi:MAG: hypothetical protein ACOX17_10435 [Christensenellales bacterium]|jgi:hypothetical protein
MAYNIYMTRISREFDAALAAAFLAAGDRVYAGMAELTPPEGCVVVNALPLDTFSTQQAMAGIPSIDCFVDTTEARLPGDGGSIREGLDDTALRESFRANLMAPLAALEAALPLMERSGMKRIVFMNSADASVMYSAATRGFGHNMSKAALNNVLMVCFNRLRPLGYTFRIYDPLEGQVSPSAAAAGAYVYITRNRCLDEHNASRDGENTLVVRDALGRELPW